MTKGTLPCAPPNNKLEQTGEAAAGYALHRAKFHLA